jgi:anti-sigma regulatory factor (Ser/Thr protein kinase)
MAGSARTAEPHDHVVNIYGAETDLIEDVCRFLADGLAADEAVVVIATEAHEAAFAHGIGQRGVDYAAACRAGRYRYLAADAALANFTVDNTLSRDRFVETIGGVIAEAASGGHRVRAYGEMVAVLWDSGDVAAAVELEEMWNELALIHRFSLYCSYSEQSLTGAADLAGVQQVCTRHSDVVPPRNYRRASRAADTSDDLGKEVNQRVECTQVFIPAPTAIQAARHFTTVCLRAWRLDSILDDAVLVASELAENAVRHARSAFRLSLASDDRTVRIEVEDLSAQRPRLDRSGTGPGGRGVFLVDALSSRWGVDVDSDRKCVWAELICEAESGPAATT